MDTEAPSCSIGSLVPGRGWRATLGACLVGLLWSPAVLADAGRFEVVSAGSRLEQDSWLVDADTDLHLSRKAIEALENGVTLYIQFQFEVNRSRRFWIDQTVTEISRTVELQYLTLSQRYVVHQPDTGAQVSFASLYSALRSLNRLRDFPLVEDAELDPDSDYWAALRIVLDREKLPGPLQMLYFWRGDFILESEWYKWTLR